MDKLKTDIRWSQWIESVGEICYIISASLYVIDGVYILCVEEVNDMVRNGLYLYASLFFLIATILMLIHSQYLLRKVNVEKDLV